MRLEVTEKLPFPEHLDIEVTNRCTLACVICPRRLMKREVGDMPLELARKILTEATGKAKTCYLHLFGDPLMHPQIEELVGMAKNAGLWVSTSTNAVFLNRDRMKKLYEAGIDELVVSLDAMTEETYDKIRVGGRFPLVMNNVLAAANYLSEQEPREVLNVQLVHTLDNDAEIEEFSRFWGEHVVGPGVGKVTIKPMVTWSRTIASRRPKEPEEEFACTMGNYSMSIYWNGDVVKCCHDFDGFTRIGSVLESSIQEVWDLPAYDEFRLAHSEKNLDRLGFCRGCYEEHK